MRWALRTFIAIGITAALAIACTPPHYLEDQFQVNRAFILGSLAGIFAGAFLAVWIADKVIIWARRRPRTLRGSGIVSFVTGLASAFFALTLWLAVLAVGVAPVGIAAAWLALRDEAIEQEGHSLLNLIGLLLNIVALAVFASQIITATIWR